MLGVSASTRPNREESVIMAYPRVLVFFPNCLALTPGRVGKEPKQRMLSRAKSALFLRYHSVLV